MSIFKKYSRIILVYQSWSSIRFPYCVWIYQLLKVWKRLRNFIDTSMPMIHPLQGVIWKANGVLMAFKKRYERHFNDSVIKDYTPAVTNKATVVIGGDQKVFQSKLPLKINLNLSPRDCWYFNFSLDWESLFYFLLSFICRIVLLSVVSVCLYWITRYRSKAKKNI